MEPYMYDTDGICWHATGRSECPIDHLKLGDKFLFYGRCKSGRRWFWTAYDFRTQGDGTKAHGWEDTEQAALDAARAAIVRIAGGHKAFATYRVDFASRELKEINAAKRAARPPPNSKDSKFTEYLYSYGKRYQIIKKTARRIYFLDKNGGEWIDDNGEPIDFGGGIRDLT